MTHKSIKGRYFFCSVIFSLVLTLLPESYLWAGDLVKDFYFPKSALRIEKKDGYDLIFLKGTDLYITEPGKPIIPYLSLNILIPPTAEITEIEILETKKIEIPGKYLLYPGQYPRPISYKGQVPFVFPDQAVYNSPHLYPDKIYEIIPSGNKSGFRIGGIFLFPVQYLPNEGKLFLYEYLQVRINFTEGIYEESFLTESQKDLFKEDVRYLVINPEDLERFSPQIRLSENPDIDYLVITSNTLAPRFMPLVNWLRKTGIWADTISVQRIYATYTGYDNAEKIRNCIIYYNNNHGTKYVLLGGDVSIIPKRGTYGSVGSYIDSFIPCDLYYFDLQYSWDGNQNNVFGDFWTISGRKDSVDLYYDVYGGRWPVETQAEVDTLIRKYFTYVKTPDTLYQRKILLPWGYLWTNDQISRQSQDTIANLSPAGWTDRYINKTYNLNEVGDSLNNGFGFCHLVGHGNEYGVYWDTLASNRMYVTYQTPYQTNYNKLTIANSIACYPGAFDYNYVDCLAEEMVKARGSAIATIMNSRYGWGTPPILGPSEKLDVRFYDHLFNRDSIRISPCHQSSKERYRNTAYSGIGYEVWRWCYYELNLFGEPSMMMWKDNPKKIIARFASVIPMGSQSFSVVCSSQGLPLSGATVCLWKGSEVYTKGTTNSSGQVSLSINPTSLGYMYVTVTAKNGLPYEDSVRVTYLKDIEVRAIEVPTGVFDSAGSLTPRIRVKNNGASSENFTAVFKIGSIYTSNRSKTLSSNQEDTINFASWIPQRGSYVVKCSVALTGDNIPTNDTMSTSITVGALDIQVVSINRPSGTIDSGPPLYPQATVKNYSVSQRSFNVSFKISNNYTSTRAKTLSPLAQDTVNFTLWTGTRGTYTAKCSVYISGDVSKQNDTLSSSFYLRVYDVGVVSIIAPADTINRDYIAPKASFKNYGSEPVSFYAYAKIYDSTGLLKYLDSIAINNLNPNATTTKTFKSFLFWVGRYTIRCSTALVNDANPSNDTRSKQVYVRYIPPWITKAPVPSGPEYKPVSSGGCLVPGGGKIYLLKGNNTLEFYRYDPDIDSWEALAPIPFIADSSKKKVNRGACLAYNNHANPDLIYATKGNNTLEFWMYDTENDSWTRKPAVPVAYPLRKVKGGASMVYLKRGTPQYIYLLKGNGTTEFYAYHCQADTWIKTLKQPPLGPDLKTYKDGSCMAVGYNNYLYLLKGGAKYNEFYAYLPASDTWITLESLPRRSSLTGRTTKVKDGAAICYDGDSLLYVIKGGNSQDFWCYNAIRNTWKELDTIPRGTLNRKLKSGSALAFLDHHIYLTKGNRTLEFWRYTPGISDIPPAKITVIPHINLTADYKILNQTPISFVSHLDNRSAVLRLTVDRKSQVKIGVYNTLGQLLLLEYQDELEAGSYEFTLNPKTLRAGVYLVKAQVNEETKEFKWLIR